MIGVFPLCKDKVNPLGRVVQVECLLIFPQTHTAGPPASPQGVIAL